MTTPSRPKTIIEFIEPLDFPDKTVAHKAKEIRINGVPVLVKADDIDLQFGFNDITSLTITLIPTEVHFRAAEPFEESKPRKPKKRKDGPHGLIERFTGYEPTKDDYALGGPKK